MESTIAKNISHNQNLQARKRSTLPIAAFVLSLISLLSVFFYYISLPAGIIAIVFSAKSIKANGSKLAKASLVLGIIGLVFCLFFYISLVILTLITEL